MRRRETWGEGEVVGGDGVVAEDDGGMAVDDDYVDVVVVVRRGRRGWMDRSRRMRRRILRKSWVESW